MARAWLGIVWLGVARAWRGRGAGMSLIGAARDCVRDCARDCARDVSRNCPGLGVPVFVPLGGRWALGAGRWALGGGRWGAGRWALGGRWELDAGRWALGAWRWARGRWALGAGRWALGAGVTGQWCGRGAGMARAWRGL
eukprot:gene14098-biopygen23094